MKYIIKSLLKKMLGTFNFTIRIRVNGKKFKIPILGGLGIANRSISEQWMIDLLKLIHPIAGSKFIDVGVNIGQTLLKIKSINKDIEYIGFEPNPFCVFYVNKLIKMNSIENTILVPVGISTKTVIEKLNFYSEDDVEGSATILTDFRENKIFRQELVPLFNVNTLKDQTNFNDMSILKIDVEGAELEVIESFKDEIKNNYPFILMEILPVYNKSKNPKRLQNQNKIQEVLHGLNYSMFRINKDKNQLLDIEEVRDIGVHSNINDCEYIFVPETRLKQFKTIVNLRCIKIMIN